MSPPRVLIAPGAFKGSLTPVEAARAIERGIRTGCPDSVLDLCPLADGGDGTLQVLEGRVWSELHHEPIQDPLDRRQWAAWGYRPEGKVAVIEAATAIGLAKLKLADRDPLRASSFGLGQLIRSALDRGAETLLIGLGGSATVDGGAGMLAALGVKDLPGQGLAGLDPRLAGTRVVALCDVRSVLLGPRGARMFMAQKGATPDGIELLERRLEQFAEVCQQRLGRDLRSVEGGGAAGGIGAALHLIGAELVPGCRFVLELLHVPERLEACDLVVSGEGRLDRQTLEGKPVLELARLAKASGKAAVALYGSRDADLGALHIEGLTAAFGILPGPDAEEGCLANGAENLARTAEEISRFLNHYRP